MIEPLRIPAGTVVLIGAPAEPMPRERASALAEMVSQIDGIQEAHLPQCFAVGVMTSPAQVLALVLAPGAEEPAVLAEVGAALAAILPQGQHLDVWPMAPGDGLLENVRSAGCRIKGAGGRQER
jgi:hypothetical protein